MRPRWPLSAKGSGERRARAHRDLAGLIDEELAADWLGSEWGGITAAQEAEWRSAEAELYREVTPLFGDSFDFCRDDWHVVVP